MENKICCKCKQSKDKSLFWKYRDKLYSYCKSCCQIYFLDKFESYKKFYENLKVKQPSIDCDCGKTITKPYYIKDHLKTKYHKNHTVIVN